MNSAVKAKAESAQKVVSLRSSIYELEKRYMVTCEEHQLEASEYSTVLTKQILALVKTIPTRFTNIMASIAVLKNVATFYGLVAGDSRNEDEVETYDGAIGLLRFVIAHGDTCLERYNQIALGKEVGGESIDIETIERNKYLIYAHFEESRADKTID